MFATPSLPDPLIARLAAVRSAGAITGAGVSAESGIATYRGSGGIYDDHEEGDRTVEALSGPTLMADPARTWRAVASLARQARDARPNAAHHALASIEARLDRFVLLTQNVDNLHHEAGSRNVIDIHGDVYATLCLSCKKPGRLDKQDLEQLDAPPRCTRCDGICRPNAVLFGETLPLHKVARIHAEFDRRPPDLVLVAGTSALFPYITAPVLVAREQGKLTVEINPEGTMLSDVVDYSLRGPAGTYLPLVEQALP